MKHFLRSLFDKQVHVNTVRFRKRLVPNTLWGCAQRGNAWYQSDLLILQDFLGFRTLPIDRKAEKTLAGIVLCTHIHQERVVIKR